MFKKLLYHPLREEMLAATFFTCLATWLVFNMLFMSPEYFFGYFLIFLGCLISLVVSLNVLLEDSFWELWQTFKQEPVRTKFIIIAVFVVLVFQSLLMGQFAPQEKMWLMVFPLGLSTAWSVFVVLHLKEKQNVR